MKNSSVEISESVNRVLMFSYITWIIFNISRFKLFNWLILLNLMVLWECGESLHSEKDDINYLKKLY